MTILVAVASRHGSTREIASAIADELRTLEVAVDLREAITVDDLTGYDAVVLGSAVYMGKWLPEARGFVSRHREQLTALPVWLFSSGPLGTDNPQPQGDPADLAEVRDATKAWEHVIFTGKIDPQALGFGERLIVKVVHAPAGDFRDWAAVRRWARAIGGALAARQAMALKA